MKVERGDSVEDFLARAGDFLVAREADHMLILGICSSLQTEPWDGPEPPYFGVVRRRGRVVLAAIRTPPWNLVLSEVDDRDALDVLAADLAEADLPGVHGPKEHVSVFAERWASLTGLVPRRHMAERSFQLRAVVAPRPAPGGLRLAESRDRELLIRWQAEFGREALGETDASAVPALVDRRISGRLGLIYVWEDGRPVSYCGVGGRTPNGIRIGPVYTPPELRGRGYASNCVAAVSQAQLEAGRSFCFLFTDLTNQTSNHIYQEIGYEPVRDVEVYRFVGASGPCGRLYGMKEDPRPRAAATPRMPASWR